MLDSARFTADVVMLGSFGVRTRGTIQSRALPLASALAGSAGLRVAIVTTPWDAPDQAGVRECVDGVLIVNTSAHDLRNASRVVREQTRLARSFRPTVIHALKPKASAGLAAAILARLDPALSLVVDYDDWEGDGGWNNSGSYSMPLRRLFSWQEADLLRRADSVTAASTLLQERAVRLRGDESASDVFYLPNGLSSDWRQNLQASARCGVPMSPRLVLYSRFAEFSSDWMIDVIQRIDRELTLPVAFDIIGDAGFGADDLPKLSRIKPHFHGYVERESLPALLGRATVALYPYEDNLINRSKQSVKLLELMASGCAIVGSRVGEVERIASNALVAVDPGDSQSFASAAASLLADPDLAAELGTKARLRSEFFDVENLASRLLGIYKCNGLN